MTYGSGAPACGVDARVARALRARLARPVLALTFVASGLLGLLAAPAFAGDHFFSGSFGSAGSGAGQLALVPTVYMHLGEEGQKVVSGGSGVAVDDETGDVYVADTGNHRVDEFEADGRFVRAWGWGVADGLPAFETCTLACQAGVSGSGPGELEAPTFIAVDNDPSSPSHGDVYVADTADDLISKFDSSGGLVESWGDNGPGSASNGQLNGPSGELFGSFAGIAVGPSGTLYVDHPVEPPGSPAYGQMFTFDQGGELTSRFTAEYGDGPAGLAVDAAGDVYVSGGGGFALRFDSSGASINPLGHSGSHLSGLAMDSVNDDVYIDQGDLVEHYALDGSGEALEPGGGLCLLNGQDCPATDSFGSGQIESGAGLAVNSSEETVYAADTAAGRIDVFSLVGPFVVSDPVSGLTGTSATLEGHVTPTGGEAVEECKFEYVEAAKYHPEASNPYGEGQTTSCSQSLPIESSTALSAEVAGLQLSTIYDFRVSVRDHEGTNTGRDLTFRTHGLEISSGSSVDVTATSVTVDAEIDPLGEPATYHFEYLTEAAYQENGDSFSGAQPATSVPQPNAAVGSGEEGVEVGQHIQGLAPGTVYRYRVVGFDSAAPGGVDGVTFTFTTQGAGGSLVLPDGREWELVSPPDKHGAGILSIFPLAPGTQAAAAGGAMVFAATAPTEAEPTGNSNFTPVLSVRGPGGWVSRDLTIPHNEGTAHSGTLGEEYQFFSSDLSLGVASPWGAFNPSLSEEASEQTLYLHTNYLNGEPGDICTSSCYRPLVTGASGFEDVRPGAEFGTALSGKKCPPEPLCGPQIVGGTPDLGHLVLYSHAGLTSTPGDDGGLYEWSGGQLQLVSVLPDGKPAHPDGLGQPWVEIGGNLLRSGVVRNTVSADGSRVYFTEEVSARNEQVLYARENIGTPQARTVPVPGGAFQTASVDGSKAFVLGGGELSEFNLESEVSAPLASGVLGVIGASEDGSSVYFVSTAVLTGEEENGQGAGAEAGEPNLYVSHAGSTTFIAALSGKDLPDLGDGNAYLNEMTSRVSPDGSWLAFMSQRSLTGYDNRDALSGVPDEEVYLYHASVGGEGGTLSCASCNPTGARPHGIEYGHLEFGNGSLGAGGSHIWEKSQWLAAYVPGWTSAYYQSRYLSDSGRLFFNSSDALVPQDTNNAEDVYEYEPPEGPEAPAGDTCTVGSSTYGPRSGGCVGLISSGTSPEESAFLDASESGEDVFFLTSARLSSLDVDSAFDVYDAHECTTASPCPPPPGPPAPACEGDACQSPAEAPNDPTPGSLTFHGPGNVTVATGPVVRLKAKTATRAQKLVDALRACEKRPKKRRSMCDAQARKRYGAVKGRPANTNRGSK